MYKIFVFVLFSSLLVAQSPVYFSNPEKVVENRYDDTKGSPFVFDDNVTINIKSLTGDYIANVNGNINIYEKQIEVYKDDEYVGLVQKDYPILTTSDPNALKELELEGLDSIMFVFHPFDKAHDAYYAFIYNESGVKLYMQPIITISTITQRPPGKIIEIKKFVKKNRMILIDQNGSKEFSLGKKEIKKALEAYGDFSKWVKKNKKSKNSPLSIIEFIQSKGG